MNLLSLAGTGALLAWVGLPLMALVARRGAARAAPASQCRALLLALASATALGLSPLGWHGLGVRLAPVSGTTVIAQLPTAAQLPVQQVAHAAIPVFACLGALWLVLVLGGLANLILRTVQVSWIARSREEIPAFVSQSAALLAQELGLDAPRLVISARATLPFVVALPRTTVVIPSALLRGLDERELALVLRHELTHLARRDHLGAVAIEVFKVLFAFHPVAERLCAEIGLAREMAVDLRLGAVAPRAYAHLLVDVAELHRFGTREAGEVALEPSSLERRIAMLTQSQPCRSARYLPILAMALALFAISSVLPLPAAADTAPINATSGAIKLKVGETEPVIFNFILEKIALGDPTIADITVPDDAKRSFNIKGLQAGTTTILVWFKDHADRQEITVTVQ